MSETANPVRQLQSHLRQAGTFIAARQFEEAAAHVDAALALDPASLAALTLQQRLRTARGPAGSDAGRSPIRDSSSVTVPPPSATPADTRFIPSGVNAASWLDFEQRVQDRRYRALIESAKRAVATGDGIAARAAIEEARELRPDSLEVEQLSRRAAMLPLVVPSSYDRYTRSRAVRAVSMLVVGVTFLMGLDWVRSDPSSSATSRQLAAGDVTPSAPIVASEIRTAPPILAGTAGFDAEGRSEQSAETSAIARVEDTGPEPGEHVASPPAVAPAPAEPLVVASAPVAARSSVSGRGEVADDYVAVRRDAAPVAAAPVAVAPPRGEIPDSYVFVPPPPVRRDAPPVRETASARPVPAAPPAAAANVVRQPTSVVESLGSARVASPPAAVPTAAPAPAPAAAPIIAPVRRDDEQLVRSALDLYARAYGRLDAREAKSVWPSVDEAKLSQAFSDLQSQSFSYEQCQIKVAGATAFASCRGRTTFTGKVGGTRTEPRTWTFDLRRDGDDWKIASAQTRR